MSKDFTLFCLYHWESPADCYDWKKLPQSNIMIIGKRFRIIKILPLFWIMGEYYNNMLALPWMLKTRKWEDVGVLVVYIRPYRNILHDVNRQTMKSVLFLP